MPNVLIREVASEDLERIRSAAADEGTSLQKYLRDAVHAQAVYLRRQEALARAAQRLCDRPGVSEADRQAVLDTVDQDHIERGDQLVDRPPQ